MLAAGDTAVAAAAIVAVAAGKRVLQSMPPLCLRCSPYQGLLLEQNGYNYCCLRPDRHVYRHSSLLLLLYRAVAYCCKHAVASKNTLIRHRGSSPQDTTSPRQRSRRSLTVFLACTSIVPSKLTVVLACVPGSSTGDEPEHSDSESVQFYVARLAYRVYNEYQHQLLEDVDGETQRE